MGGGGGTTLSAGREGCETASGTFNRDAGRTTGMSGSLLSTGQYGQRSHDSSMKCPFSHRLSATMTPHSRVVSNGDRVATTKVDDVAVLQEALVDLLIVDISTVRRIPVDQHDLAVDGNDFCMETGNLRVFQYDLTNRRLPADPDPRAAEAEPLAGARAVEDREAAEHQRREAAFVRHHRFDRRRDLHRNRKAVAALRQQQRPADHDETDRRRGDAGGDGMQPPRRQRLQRAVGVVPETD